MARQPRFDYPGAIYHVVARGDGGKLIFEGEEDHESFLYWLCDAMIKNRTAVANDWIAERLAMGHPALMSQRHYPTAPSQLPPVSKLLRQRVVHVWHRKILQLGGLRARLGHESECVIFRPEAGQAGWHGKKADQRAVS